MGSCRVTGGVNCHNLSYKQVAKRRKDVTKDYSSYSGDQLPIYLYQSANLIFKISHIEPYQLKIN